MVNTTILLSVELLLILPMIYYKVVAYRTKATSFPMTLFLFGIISWQVISFLMLPLDLVDASEENHDTEEKLTYWRVFYWTNFFLGFFVLQIAINYYSSGKFTTKEKILDACYISLLWNLIPLALALVFWVVLLIKKKMTISGTPTTIIALTNA